MTFPVRLMKFSLFNCDKTYNLDSVETLLQKVANKLNLKMLVDKCYFGLREMSDVCGKTIPMQQMDYAIFVIHADESRLSINEENAGIGYAKIYKALLQATGDKVLIIIGGDKYYKDEDEKEQFVISRWVRRKVASQFDEEYFDGRESFIFSWNKEHREIHEEALEYYLNPNKRGEKFRYEPKPTPAAPETTDSSKEVINIGACDLLVENDELDLENDSIKKERQKCYGATLGADAVSASVDHQKGTLLIETHMRYGKIWLPSEETVEVLERDWKSVRDAKVQFIVSEFGRVNCHVTKERRRFWKRFEPSDRSNVFNNRLWSCWLAIYNCARACCCDCCCNCRCDCCCNACNK